MYVCECVWTSTALVHRNITICQAGHLYILFSDKDDRFQRVLSLEIASTLEVSLSQYLCYLLPKADPYGAFSKTESGLFLNTFVFLL